MGYAMGAKERRRAHGAKGMAQSAWRMGQSAKGKGERAEGGKAGISL